MNLQLAYCKMLATPISMARPKKLLSVDDRHYSHFTQTRWEDSDITKMATTWNATRTFDYKGNPKDADND